MRPADSHKAIERLDQVHATRVNADVTIPCIAAAAEQLALNALDAHATQVHLSADVPSRQLTLTDDGHGVNQHELPLLGVAYATSRAPASANSPQDAYGRRGAALRALASVSLLEIVSRTAAPAGAQPLQTYSTLVERGSLVRTGLAREPRAVGTTVTVRDLFANRAVERKRLARAGAAGAEIVRLLGFFSRLAVANPHVSFRLHDASSGRTLLSTARGGGEGDIPRIMGRLLGGGAPLPLRWFVFDDVRSSVRVEGHATLDPLVACARELQIVCVNRRPLSRRSAVHRLVESALARAAGSAERQSAADGDGVGTARRAARPFFLRLLCDPRMYDASLYGDRGDVTFRDEAAVKRAVEGAVDALVREHAGPAKAGDLVGVPTPRTPLRSLDAEVPPRRDIVGAARASRVVRAPTNKAAQPRLTPPPHLPVRAGEAAAAAIEPQTPDASWAAEDAAFMGAPEATAVALTAVADPCGGGGGGGSRRLKRRRAAPAVAAGVGVGLLAAGGGTVSKEEVRQLRVVGQVERRFIAARTSTGLFMVDQHAADERVLLERLTAATVRPRGLPQPQAFETRQLSEPLPLRATVTDAELLRRFADRASAWGWDIRTVASSVFLLTVPSLHGVELGERALLGYVRALGEAGGGDVVPPAVRSVLASKACRRAVMFGDALDRGRMQQILSELGRCDFPFQCAHGRPTLAPVLKL